MAASRRRQKQIYFYRLVEWERSLDLWLDSLWIDAESGNMDEDWQEDFSAWIDSLAAWTNSAEDYCRRHEGERIRMFTRDQVDDLFEEEE